MKDVAINNLTNNNIGSEVNHKQEDNVKRKRNVTYEDLENRQSICKDKLDSKEEIQM